MTMKLRRQIRRKRKTRINKGRGRVSSKFVLDSPCKPWKCVFYVVHHCYYKFNTVNLDTVVYLKIVLFTFVTIKLLYLW